MSSRTLDRLSSVGAAVRNFASRDASGDGADDDGLWSEFRHFDRDDTEWRFRRESATRGFVESHAHRIIVDTVVVDGERYWTIAAETTTDQRPDDRIPFEATKDVGAARSAVAWARDRLDYCEPYVVVVDGDAASTDRDADVYEVPSRELACRAGALQERARVMLGTGDGRVESLPKAEWEQQIDARDAGGPQRGEADAR